MLFCLIWKVILSNRKHWGLLIIIGSLVFCFFFNSNSKPAPELLNEYSRKVDFLKGLLEAEKLVRYISSAWKDFKSIIHLFVPCFYVSFHLMSQNNTCLRSDQVVRSDKIWINNMLYFVKRWYCMNPETSFWLFKKHRMHLANIFPASLMWNLGAGTVC